MIALNTYEQVMFDKFKEDKALSSLTDEEVASSVKNWFKARKFFHLKSGDNKVMHHINPNWRYKDLQRYIQWNPDDLIAITREEHEKIHKYMKYDEYSDSSDEVKKELKRKDDLLNQAKDMLNQTADILNQLKTENEALKSEMYDKEKKTRRRRQGEEDKMKKQKNLFIKLDKESTLQLLKDESLTCAELKVYISICNHCYGNKEESFPGQKLIQEETHLTQSTISNAIKKLQKKGFITIEKHKNKSGFTNNIYHINYHSIEKVDCDEEENFNPKLASYSDEELKRALRFNQSRHNEEQTSIIQKELVARGIDREEVNAM